MSAPVSKPKWDPHAVQRFGFIPSNGQEPRADDIAALHRLTASTMEIQQSASPQRDPAARAETIARMMPKCIDMEMGMRLGSDQFFKLIFTDTRSIIFTTKILLQYLEANKESGIDLESYMEGVGAEAISTFSLDNPCLASIVNLSQNKMPRISSKLFEESGSASRGGEKKSEKPLEGKASDAPASASASPASPSAGARAPSASHVPTGLPSLQQIESLEMRMVKISQANMATGGRDLADITAQCLQITAQVCRADAQIAQGLALGLEQQVIGHKAIAAWLRLGQPAGSLEDFVQSVVHEEFVQSLGGHKAYSQTGSKATMGGMGGSVSMGGQSDSAIKAQAEFMLQQMLEAGMSQSDAILSVQEMFGAGMTHSGSASQSFASVSASGVDEGEGDDYGFEHVQAPGSQSGAGALSPSAQPKKEGDKA